MTSRPFDSGARHLAFRVKNIDDVIAACRQAGVIPISPTIPEFADRPARGVKAVYTTDQDGIVIEFMEDPRIQD